MLPGKPKKYIYYIIIIFSVQYRVQGKCEFYMYVVCSKETQFQRDNMQHDHKLLGALLLLVLFHCVLHRSLFLQQPQLMQPLVLPFTLELFGYTQPERLSPLF